MQLSPRPFATARDAHDAFGDLPDDVDVRLAETTPMATPAYRRPRRRPSEAPKHESKPTAKPSSQLSSKRRRRIGEAPVRRPVLPPIARDRGHQTAPAPARGFSKVAIGIIAALALLAVGQAAALFALPYTKSRDRGRRDSAGRDRSSGHAAGTARLRRYAGRSAAVARPCRAAGGSAPGWTPRWPRPSAAAPVAAGPIRRHHGDVRHRAAGLQGRQARGINSGPIAVNEGPHNLEFVNEALGFVSRRPSTSRAGR